MANIEIRPIKDRRELEEMYYQRWLVLREPLGMELGSEKDDRDDNAFHLIAVCNSQIVASARLRELSPDEGTIAYVAVLPQFQHQGIGTKLIHKLIETATQKNFKRLKLKSRLTALNFYKKLGFSPEGQPFDYLGIPHIFMHLHIPIAEQPTADFPQNI